MMEATPSIPFNRRTLLDQATVRGLLTLSLVLGCLSSRPIESVQAQTEARPSYEISATVDAARGTVDVQQVTTFTNWTGRQLASIVLRLPAAEVGRVSALTGTSTNQAGPPELNGVVVEIPLQPALQPRERARVSLSYTITLPRQAGRLGMTSQSITLGNWFATLAVHQGDWDRRPFTDVGDAFYTEVADYSLEIETLQSMELAFTGVLTQRNGNRWSIQAQNVRDVAIVGSSRFTTAQAQVGGATITAYALNGPAQRLADTAAEMVGWYSARFGAYPYSQLRVVEADLPASFGGMEYPGLVMLSTQYGPLQRGSAYEALIAHEIAHQWFYSYVGNDQIDAPWVDEGLATYAPVLFYLDVAPSIGQSQLRTIEASRGGLPIDTSVFAFRDDSSYFTAIYRPTARMLNDVRQIMGADAFDAAIRDYVSTFGHRIASPRAFLDLLQRHSTTDLNPTFGRYVNYEAFNYAAVQSWSSTIVDPTIASGSILEVRSAFPIGMIEVWLDSQQISRADLAGAQYASVPLDLSGSPAGEHVLLTRVFNAEGAQFEQATRVTVR